MACINAECQDPCLVNRPCHRTQTCKVEPSSPIRTVICICPDDSFIGPNGECTPKGSLGASAAVSDPLSPVTPVAACSVDRDCGDPDKCVEGTCRDACYVDPCGANAICKSRLHASTCTCPIGYTGNPQVQCLKSKYLAPRITAPLHACCSHPGPSASPCPRVRGQLGVSTLHCLHQQTVPQPVRSHRPLCHQCLL